MVKKFFVTRSGVGYERGIYTQTKTRKLPKSAHPHVVSLATAIGQGWVEADYNSGEHINELDVYAPVDSETGKQEKIRGVKEGILKKHETTTKKSASPKTKKKIDNTLRAKITTAKKKSQEDSIKAKIAAKKKSNKK